jgi:peptide/nickel transport system substrate-binding protein
MRTRLIAGTAVTASLVLALAACSSSGSTSPSASGSGASGTSAATTGYQAAHAGGTLTLLAKSAGGTLDPKVNYTLQYWQLYQATYDGLTAFKKVNGQDSFTVVPDLAEAIPTPTNGGKTYVFTLRKGIKFSDGTDVTTDDVVASFQRIFKVSSPTAGSFYNGIVGADACLKTPATCTAWWATRRRARSRST